MNNNPQGLDFFQSLMKDVKTLNDSKRPELPDALKAENAQVA